MGYTWTDGELITATKLNNTGGGDFLYDIGVEDGTLDKTWTEIYTAHSGGKIVRIVQSAEGYSETQYVVATVNDDGTYFVYFGAAAAWYQTSTSSGYPVYVED